jgi:superfamily II DNA or RNA helicase
MSQNSIKYPKIKEEDILEGHFWPERIRVLQCRNVGAYIEIDGVGLNTGRFYSNILTVADLEKIRLVKLKEKDFLCDSESFFLVIEGKRIRLAHQFDPLYAVNVSQIDPLPHQIDAVYFHILKQPKIRFLLADDPGAGKTIMAGLLLKELKQRGLVNRVLIVIPGHLKDQWIREMKEKFGETFKVIDRAVMEASWGRNVWLEENQVITSMDFAKQEDVMLSLAEAAWDLVIVDEAHKLAAYEYGTGKMTKTQRYKLGERLSKNSNFLLFLTAIPHRGDPSNFRLFLDLLEPGFFATNEILMEATKNRENPLFLRRLKEDLKTFDGTPLFPPRKVKTIKYRLSPDEKRLYNAVTEYVEKYYNKALEIKEERRRRNITFALLILQRRLASSVRAVRKSLERRKSKLEELLKQGELIQEVGYVSEEVLEDMPEIERWEREEELLEKLTSSRTLEELKEEIDKLEVLIQLAKEVEKKEIETKLNELRNVMETEKLKERGEKLLIFTESKDTLDYLVEKFREWGFTVTYIHGGMNLDKRIQAEHEFREKAQIMVSTEAGGEGINLQFCWLMVNYDIPWNPNRLEQRMGRIHRYGQQYEVHIYNLVATDTKEGMILEKLLTKLEIIGEQVGKVFDVIGDVISAYLPTGKTLQDLIIEAITNRRSLDEILQDFERIPDEEAIKRAREASLEGIATRYIDFSRILGEMRVAKENRLVPEYIEKFFLKAAEKLGVKVELRKDGFWRISNVPNELRNLSYDFKNRYGVVFKEYGKFSFDKEKAFKGQAEFVAPGHPLLEAIIEKIFEKYSGELERGATFTDPSGILDGFIWFLEGQINDGNGQVAGKRIFALYQDIQTNHIKQVSPSILWDLKPVNPTLLKLINLPVMNENAIITFAVENILTKYLDEIKRQREHDAEIKRKYGLRSLQELILRSEEKLIEYETKRAKGIEIPEAVIQAERRKKEDFERKKAELEKRIIAETNLLLSPPKILGVVRVIPQTPIEDELKEDLEIEKIGMQITMSFEISQGRNPEDVSLQNLGFDIRSKAFDGSYRYIEVKARAREGKIALTPNEWLMANRLKDEYWLYVVVNVATKPELYTIQDPATKLKPNEVVEIVRYIVDKDDWKNIAKKEFIGEGT